MPEIIGTAAKVAAIAIFLAIWGGLNYYVGWRGWYYFGNNSYAFKYVYGAAITFLACSYLLGRWGNSHWPGMLSDGMIWIGSYWMAFWVYGLLACLLADLIRYMDRLWNFLPNLFHQNYRMVAAVVLLSIIGLLIYGTINAVHPVINRYRVVIPKTAGERESLHIVMVSDLHLGNLVDNNRLRSMVKQINRLHPEIVLMAGDIIDGDSQPFEEQHMAKTLRLLKAPLGVYAVPGNHEYLGGQYRQLLKDLQDSGVVVLRDQNLWLDGFYLAGRDDRISRQRKPLREVISGVDNHFPLILMDHNPADIKEAEKNRVDLQLSGHTHAGQFWPLNFFTEKMFLQDWGYLHRGDTQIIVSNGYGTWGPPVRIGNRPEIVEIWVEFEK
ncbi:MAG TPA: metallophosphoesterase [Syntrophomonas sp.]|nr:metallophosphoesterase [Syntrophomonas sp.]